MHFRYLACQGDATCDINCILTEWLSVCMLETVTFHHVYSRLHGFSVARRRSAKHG
jgi:hypothetical protein